MGERYCGAELHDELAGLIERLAELPSPSAFASARQLELFTAKGFGPRGFPLCGECSGEGIGPFMPWCVQHWTPERDPEGAMLARQLGLLSSS